MNTAVVIRHVAFEDLGLLASLLSDSGYNISYIESGVGEITTPEVDNADLLVVLGGPIGVGDSGEFPFLTVEISLLRRRIVRGLPTLGICLGAQLIAVAAGGSICSTGRFELGFAPISLTDEGHHSVLRHLEGVNVLHWHSDEFLIPPGAVRLASSALFDNQAFSIGASILAVQFHMEADMQKLEQWLIGHWPTLQQQGCSPTQLRLMAREHGQQLMKCSRDVMAEWLEALETPRSF